ncbi:restriction endonuclease [Spirochaetota bacterium]|nr:restriction endonuclease [Spirochaetota bacterium]
MNIVYEYSHLGGLEILKVRYSSILEEILTTVKSIKVPKTKISQEKTRRGKLLYSPKKINAAFSNELRKLGFQEIKDHYNIEIPEYRTTIKSYKQIDFHKEKVLIEVQFGKYAFMFYDMAKFQYFYNEAKANVGIEIVPCSRLKKCMSTGVSYGEQLIYDIERPRRHFPAVPVYIILVDM